MTQRDNILQELRDLKSGLADITLQTTYRVPVGYFDGLADQVMRRIKALESADAVEELESLSPLLSSISKKMPYSTPKGYFEELGKQLEQAPASDLQTVHQELEDLSPLLAGLKNKSTYTVPAGYFENFPATISKKIGAPEVKVISITSRKWLRYAAAALVIGFVATIGFLFLRKGGDVDPSDKSYAWVKQNLKKVSTDEINEFVELASAETVDAVKLEAKEEISNLLKDVSDKEIQEFLNDTEVAETGSESEDDLILN